MRKKKRFYLSISIFVYNKRRRTAQVEWHTTKDEKNKLQL